MVSAYVCDYVLLTFVNSCNRRLACQDVKGLNPVKLLKVVLGHQMDIWTLQIAGVITYGPCVKLQALQ